MKLVLSILLVVASMALGTARPRWFELSEEYSYDQYLVDQMKGRPSASEYEMRKSLFQQRLREAMEHNSGNKSWKKGVNRFSDWTLDEIKSIMGGKKPYLMPDVPHKTFHATKSVSDLPTHVDWREKGVVLPTKDQGHCGSCYSFSSTAVLESHLAMATGVIMELSPQEIVSCNPNPNDCGGFGGCLGSTADLTYDYVRQNGMSTPYKVPYVSYEGTTNGTCPSNVKDLGVMTVEGFVKVDSNNNTAVMEAVATNGPLTVNVAAVPWHSYEEGVFDGCSENGTGTDIDHVVALVGYVRNETDAYYIIKNSWSPLWGVENGYIKLKMHENCGIDKAPQDGTGCNGGPSQVSVCGECGVLYDATYPYGAKITASH